MNDETLFLLYFGREPNLCIQFHVIYDFVSHLQIYLMLWKYFLNLNQEIQIQRVHNNKGECSISEKFNKQLLE